MKNYFSFNLTGKKLLPIWALFLVFFLAPYLTLIFAMKNLQFGESPTKLLFPLLILLVVIAFALTFYIAKLTIENVSLNGKFIVFNGSFGRYIWTILLGSFLSILTLGVYSAWFVRDIHRFFIDNSSYDSNALKFQGKGGKLFVILLLTIVIPIIVLVIIMFQLMFNNPGQIASVRWIQQLVMPFIMIPYMYLVYNWMINVDYKDFNISWKTDFWSACGKIGIEVILSLLTLGIYGPLATLRLYKYFTERTVAQSSERELRFGYDLDQLKDFLFLWGQLLLTLITLGIYYPWAFCKIGSRILGKTYLIEI